VIERAAHRGPLRVQRAFYPEGDGVAHVYLLHPPGGLVGGDSLEVAIDVEAGAAAVITTPAAAKLYRSQKRLARVEVRAHVASGASLEYLPLETIAFSGCHAHTHLRVELEAGATFFGWDVIALGRPASGEAFGVGELTSRVELWRAGVPLLHERMSISGSGEALSAAWGLRGHHVIGTAVGVGDGLAAVDIPPATAPAATSITRVEDDVVVARYLGDDPFEARGCFEAVRDRVRASLVGRPAVQPRIWAT
jgi:urease accessory protein